MAGLEIRVAVSSVSQLCQGGGSERQHHEGSWNSRQALSLSPDCPGCSAPLNHFPRGAQIHSFTLTTLSVLCALHKDISYQQSCNTHCSIAVNILFENQNAALVFPSLSTQLKPWITSAAGVQIIAFANGTCDKT